MSSTAGTLIRECRSASGMTQRQLAAASGVAAPTLSAYENGLRDPGAETLAKVLRATGRELVAVPSRSARSRHVELVMEMTDVLPKRLEAEMRFPPFRTLIRDGA